MRIFNRPVALLLALALAAAGVITVIEVVAHALGAGPVVVPWTTWEHWAGTTRWNRAVVKVWAVVLIAVGLILIVLQLKPRRVDRVQVTAHDENTDVALTRKGLAGAVRGAVLDVDGIARAETVAARRSVRVAATASARDPETAGELTEPVEQAARAQIDSLNLTRPPKVRVKVKGAKS